MRPGDGEKADKGRGFRDARSRLGKTTIRGHHRHGVVHGEGKIGAVIDRMIQQQRKLKRPPHQGNIGHRKPERRPGQQIEGVGRLVSRQTAAAGGRPQRIGGFDEEKRRGMKRPSVQQGGGLRR